MYPLVIAAFLSLGHLVSGGKINQKAEVDQLVGFGGTATGGGGTSKSTAVTSCSELSTALKTPGIIQINGTLTGCGILKVVSNTTIVGVGSKSGLTGGGLQLKGVNNVFIRNLKFHKAPKGGDLVSLDKATNVWIDHNEFSSEGLKGDKDEYDGLLDITHGSDFVTVSWNKFSDHWKGSLIGHSDSNGAEDKGHLRVTYHHNAWNNVNSRLPSLRFGTGHVYSSCYTNCPSSGINSRMGAQVLAEQNYFDNVKLAIVTNLDSDQPGYATEKNNVLAGSSSKRITQGATFQPPYEYAVDTAADTCAIISKSGGTGVIG